MRENIVLVGVGVDVKKSMNESNWMLESNVILFDFTSLKLGPCIIPRGRLVYIIDIYSIFLFGHEVLSMLLVILFRKKNESIHFLHK